MRIISVVGHSRLYQRAILLHGVSSVDNRNKSQKSKPKRHQGGPVGGEVPLSRLFAGPRKEKAGLYYYFSFFQIISSKRIPQISVLQVQCVLSQPHFLIHSRNTIPHPTHLIFDSFGTEQRAGPYPPLHTLPRPVRGNSAVCAKSGLGSIEHKHSPAMPPTPSKEDINSSQAKKGGERERERSAVRGETESHSIPIPSNSVGVCVAPPALLHQQSHSTVQHSSKDTQTSTDTDACRQSLQPTA
eukprot:gene7540-5319_t